MVKGGHGVACGVVSIPLRYMHSPNETASLADIDACAELVAAYVRALPAVPDFRV
jgi:endoglucanase